MLTFFTYFFRTPPSKFCQKSKSQTLWQLPGSLFPIQLQNPLRFFGPILPTFLHSWLVSPIVIEGYYQLTYVSAKTILQSFKLYEFRLIISCFALWATESSDRQEFTQVSLTLVEKPSFGQRLAKPRDRGKFGADPLTNCGFRVQVFLLMTLWRIKSFSKHSFVPKIFTNLDVSKRHCLSSE